MAKEKTNKKESTLYFFTATGCAFCKRLDPIIDKINNEGEYEILKLDISDKDNVGLKKEIEKEYDIKCGTPLLVDADSGNYVCGFRDEDTVKKWASGEKIPTPPRPKSQPPVAPKDMNNQKEVTDWKKLYEKWAEENKHMPNIPNSNMMLNRLKQQYEATQKRNITPGSNLALESRITTLEQKIDRLISHLGVK